MAKMKIFELKNIINNQIKGNVESKDIQTFLENKTGVKKTHSSNLEDNEVQMVKNHFIPADNKPAAPVQNPVQSANQNVQGNKQQNNTRTSASIDSSSQGNSQQGGARPTGADSLQHRTQGTQNNTRMTYDNNSRPKINQQGQQNPNYQGGQRSSGNTGNQNARPYGSNQNNQGNQGGQRSGGYQGNQGGYQGSRPNNQGQGGYQGNNPRPVGQGHGGNQGGYQGSNPRPAGQGGYQGNNPRPAGQSGYQGNNPRPAGQGGQRTGGYQGNQGGYQGNRSNNQGQGYQGGNRSEGQGGYQGNNPRPAGQGYNGNQGGYQGNNPRPAGQGYQGNNPRPAGQGYQGNQGGYQGNRPRPYGQDGSQGGNRPTGQDGRPRNNFGGNQSNNYRPNNQRPAGGFGSRGFEDFNKDEDDKPSYLKAAQGGARKPGAGKGGERKNFDQQILDQKVAEKNDFSNKRNRDRINKEKSYRDKNIVDHDENEDDNLIKSKLAPRKGQFIQPKPVVIEKEDDIKTISIPEVLTIKELSDKMKLPASAVVKKLFLAGKMVSINSEITYDEAEEIALGYEIIVEKEVLVNEVEELLKEEEEDVTTMTKRPPVVCVMGHVDHGKTSLLDAIREANVTSREAGGITQHIGAYVVEVNGEKITFLDTPGHEAFTSMRMRGAQSTDIAILVVAADDGVMPQTVEAINHAKAAGVQIIVAINKIDKPSANIERVKQELTEYELIAEDWGGDTIFVPVSAHTKEGIEQLLEMILLTAEMGELKANADRNARGLVIEAELDKGRGPVATILVQKGTLKVGDNVVVGSSYGKVRAMMDDKGRRVKEATPSTPVEILGLNEVPAAGEIFMATTNEKEARTISEAFISQGREKLLADTKAKLSLDGLFSQIQAGNIKDLNLIIKADVQGSVEAMKQSLVKLSNEEVAVRIIHGGVGAINESDVILASASNAIIIGFNVRPDNAAKDRADREKVDVKLYRVIYNAIDDIEAAMKGLLDPVFEMKVIGHAEIRQTFKASGIGTIAGSYVLDGKIQRGCSAKISRDNTVIYDGPLASLKRFQDDVKEVATGYECGLVFEKFNDVKEGDRVELYIMVEVPR